MKSMNIVRIKSEGRDSRTFQNVSSSERRTEQKVFVVVDDRGTHEIALPLEEVTTAEIKVWEPVDVWQDMTGTQRLRTLVGIPDNATLGSAEAQAISALLPDFADMPEPIKTILESIDGSLARSAKIKTDAAVGEAFRK